MKRGVAFFLFGIVMIGPLLKLACQAQQTQSTPSGEFATREAWRKSMKQTPLPKNGCFTASYPSTTWQEVACMPPPSVHSLPPRAAGPDVVGNGYDFTALVSGSISSATGSFPVVSGLASANSYSLQLNTNLFHTSACNGAAVPSQCLGWVQFVFNQSIWQVYREYTLINWGSTNCPAGWSYYPYGSNFNCYINVGTVGVTSQPLANLPYMELTGEAAGETDTVILSTQDGIFSSEVQDSPFGDDLAQYWDEAEFNVFGDDNYAEVNFNSGTTFVVQTSVNNGTTVAPQYFLGGTTGETNNLSLVPQSSPLACAYGGTTPNIQFMESNASGATATCGANGLEGNFAATPYSINGKKTPITHPIIEGELRVEYSATLEDSASGATIYFQLFDACGNSLGAASVSPGTSIQYLLTAIDGESCTYSLSGTMYATAPGYLQSLTSSIAF